MKQTANNQNGTILNNLAPITDSIAESLGFVVEELTCGRRKRAFYYYRDENGQDRHNKNGERLIIEVTHCEDGGGAHSLPALWQKRGATATRLSTYWGLSTFVYDKDGECYGDYNPQTRWDATARRPLINFEYMEEATAESFRRLLVETLRRFEACGE